MSKYNKKLPKPTNLRFINSARSSGANELTMPFGGVIPAGISYLGWKQTSFTYSYQVQYYVKARLVPDKQLATGKTWTQTAWKYPNTAWGSVKVDSLNKGVTVDKKNRWYRYLNFAGKSMMTKGSYDRLIIGIRVRSYNPKAKEHGAWVTGKVYFSCVPTVKVHKVVALADGGIRVYLNTGGWKRGDSRLILRDVRHEGASNKQNKKDINVEVDAIGGEEAANYPYVDVAGSHFNTDFQPNEKVVFKNCIFRTCDGADAAINGTYSIESVNASIAAPVVSIARDEDAGEIKATFSKGNASDDWDKSEAWLMCDVRGESVRVNHVNVTGSDDASRVYRFHPPLDASMRLHFGITNDLGGACYMNLTKADHEELRPLESNGRVMVNYSDGTETQPKNGQFYGSKVASMVYETDISTDATREAESFMPYGRTRPFATLGEGVEKTINVKGSIGNTDDGFFEPVAFSGYYDWLDFQQQQGLVLLRMPNADTCQALCTKATISQSDEYDETKSVDLSFMEVDV